MGAWIEIMIIISTSSLLKSLPSWERGLKLSQYHQKPLTLAVAPLVGAWIEIIDVDWLQTFLFVAPLVGAWIEISECPYFLKKCLVAPLVGAWIEILPFLTVSALR